MGSDEMIVFEETHYDELTEKFIQKNISAWEDFVAEEYQGHCSNKIDSAKDR